MIPNRKLVKDAEAYVRGTKPSDVHPDVASRMATFTRSQERGDSDAAVQAHAKALLDLVQLVGEPDDTEKVTRPRATAKKAPAKKSAAKKAPARSKE